jgi:dye decolorizing peroxidase
LGGAAVGIGVAATASAARAGVLPAPSRPDLDGLNGDRVVPFYGAHQAGVTSTPGAFVTYVSLALLSSTTREDMRSLMRLLTDDAARLTQGIGPLADIEPELVANPAGLTVTFGFGAGFVARAGATAPRWLATLPAFSIDRLEERYSGADLLLILHGDDKVVISHAVRLLLRDSRRFASHLWTQSGFRQSYGTAPQGTTMRNLFGQLDGTANFAPGSKDFDAAVSARADAPGWLQGGGTSFVLRRIAMDLEGWDEVGREGRGEVVGRHIDTGAPLTGKHEHDAPDFEAKGPLGFTVINPASHIARAHAAEPEQSIVRMAHNYDDPPEGEATSNVGLLFGSWQADVAAQFVPMQERLAQGDLLNQWTTPIGSTVVAIPPGCEPGGFIGEGLLS